MLPAVFSWCNEGNRTGPLTRNLHYSKSPLEIRCTGWKGIQVPTQTQVRTCMQTHLPIFYVSLWCQLSGQRWSRVTTANKNTLHNAWRCHTQDTRDKTDHRNLSITTQKKGQMLRCDQRKFPSQRAFTALCHRFNAAPSPCNQEEEWPILKIRCMKITITEACQNCLLLLNTDSAEPDRALLAVTMVIVFSCQEKALNNVFQLNHKCHLYYVYLPDFNIWNRHSYDAFE